MSRRVFAITFRQETRCVIFPFPSSDRSLSLLKQVGESFWEAVLLEHGLNESGVSDTSIGKVLGLST